MLPILRIDELKVGGENWKQVDDFDSSGPLDKHFCLLDKENGSIQFGDNEYGAIPFRGATVSLKYKNWRLD